MNEIGSRKEPWHRECEGYAEAPMRSSEAAGPLLEPADAEQQEASPLLKHSGEKVVAHPFMWEEWTTW